MNPGRLPRFANILLGTWLTLTVLLWPHTRAQGWSTVLSGLVIVTAATVAVLAQPRARYGGVAAGAWVVASCFVLDGSSMATVLNNAVVGTLVVLLALVPVAENGRIASLSESSR